MRIIAGLIPRRLRLYVLAERPRTESQYLALAAAIKAGVGKLSKHNDLLVQMEVYSCPAALAAHDPIAAVLDFVAGPKVMDQEALVLVDGVHLVNRHVIASVAEQVSIPLLWAQRFVSATGKSGRLMKIITQNKDDKPIWPLSVVSPAPA
ncbi:MAG: hypothetical protein U9M92_01675 [Patescibacteria group bacterium]|nr:hypothetical protein [Patescibacteria group bacterium]